MDKNKKGHPILLTPLFQKELTYLHTVINEIESLCLLIISTYP